jgi:hypothetical protein
MSDKTLRQSKRDSWVVPFCGNIEGFILDEVVIPKKHVVFFKTDGVIEFQGDGEVGWNTSRTNLETQPHIPVQLAPGASPSPIPIADET